jgi:dihydrofolate synthase/folylpolyglutamate synthase
LHPKEIDLSLNRIQNLCKKLGNPQDKIKCISIVGTNGKWSTIKALQAILKEANYKCNIYSSPHIQKINERFVYDNQKITNDNLANLLDEVEEINGGNPITFFEILTAAYFYEAKKYPKNINLIESGLFHRFDATNILKKNLASIITIISLDHLDWLPKNQQTIEKIIFEKTSTLLESKIIIAKQETNEITNHILNTLSNNQSEKITYNKNYSYVLKENDFFYYEDEFGGLKLQKPNLIGEFQIENVSTAISAARHLAGYDINDDHIKNGITKIKNIARLQEIKKGKLKNLVKKNKLFIDGSHNPLGAKVLNEYLLSLNCNKHIILGMMANKDHIKYVSYFKNISSLITIDIPNQPNAIRGIDLKEKIKNFPNIQNKNTIVQAILSIPLKENDIILITGSLYLASEVLNLN